MTENGTQTNTSLIINSLSNTSITTTVPITWSTPAANGSTSSERRNHEDKSSLLPYIGSAVDFLKEYGDSFGLFDIFLNRSSVYKANDDNEFSRKYHIRNHSIHYMLGGSRARVGIYDNWSSYPRSVNSDAKRRINNRFRYGNRPNDRFLDIFLRGDPWDDINGPFMILNITVHFTGYLEELEHEEDSYCDFKFPATGRSKMKVTRFPDENLISNNNFDTSKSLSKVRMYTCDIPFSIPDHLSIEDMSKELTPHPKVLKFDLVSGGNTLLTDIEIPRLHMIDRRKFNYTVCTITDNINDKKMNEWLVYNIMLGVEHFYIFDNNKEELHSHSYLWNSLLRPFLDANIVTLINYPYTAPIGEFWGQIQRSTFQVMLQKYSIYSDWVGFYDVDEFLLPDEKFRNDLLKDKDPFNSLKSVPKLIEKLWGHEGFDKRVPAIMFDSREMACTSDSSFYGTNKEVSYVGAAFSTSCTVRGFKFTEYTNGHGKMFVRPEQTPILTTPHRSQNYFAIWTKEDNGGLFYHFDGFRYHPSNNFLNLDSALKLFVTDLINITMSYSKLIRPVSRDSPSNGQMMISEREVYAHRRKRRKL